MQPVLRRLSHPSQNHQLREECRRRAHGRRQEALQSRRAGRSPGDLQAAVRADVRAAVQDLLIGVHAAASPSPLRDLPSQSGQQQQQQQLSPFHFSQQQSQQPSSQQQGQQQQQEPPPAVTAADVDAFLAELEREIVGELLRELEAHEAHDAAALAAAVAEREALEAAARAGGGGFGVQGEDGGGMAGAGAADADAEPLLCPVCMGAFLGQRAGVVACPRGCLCLNLAHESLSLADLRRRLAAAFEEHGAAGCGGRLAFRAEQLFGTANLTAACGGGGCQFYRVVI